MPETPIRCSQCGRTFRMPAHLARHMSATHGRGRAARPAPRASLPIVSDGLAQVRQGLQRHLDDLVAQRNQLEARMAVIEQALQTLTGAPARAARAVRGRRAVRAAGRAGAPRPRPAAPGRRGFRKGSLKDYITRVLTRAGQPMAVKDIAAAVRQAGYPTKNKTLEQSVSVALANMPGVRKVSRGVYRAR